MNVIPESKGVGGMAQIGCHPATMANTTPITQSKRKAGRRCCVVASTGPNLGRRPAAGLGCADLGLVSSNLARPTSSIQTRFGRVRDGSGRSDHRGGTAREAPVQTRTPRPQDTFRTALGQCEIMAARMSMIGCSGVDVASDGSVSAMGREGCFGVSTLAATKRDGLCEHAFLRLVVSIQGHYGRGRPANRGNTGHQDGRRLSPIAGRGSVSNLSWASERSARPACLPNSRRR